MDCYLVRDHLEVFFKNKFINKNLDFAFDFDESIYFFNSHNKLIGIAKKIKDNL